MIYQAYQAYADATDPARSMAGAIAPLFNQPWFGAPAQTLMRNISAALDTFARTRLTHKPPAFGIRSVREGGPTGPEVAVHEEVAHVTPFCTLRRFRKDIEAVQPRVLVVAPMSGHFATLLRGTVRTLLRDHDVYITDWHNARDVAMADGAFGLDDYIEHVMRFLEVLGPGAHVVAVCQPTVPTLAAVAVMAADNNPAQPATMTLMAGPIDTRINPTAVNELASSKPISWFEKNLIGSVPARYVGAKRRVYPGFLQLSAFMSMNPDRHIESFSNMYCAAAQGDSAKAEPIQTFYKEYFAMADLPAEFYLETVEKIFQQQLLPRGELEYRGRLIDPALIKRTALLTVEGEKDDICAVGQTLAAQELCSGIRPYRKRHYVQTGAGHYGVFNGRRWDNEIYPLVREFIHVAA